MEIKDLVGKKITATYPCYMEDNINEPTLTVGKEYEIVDYILSQPPRIIIIDDQGDEHQFNLKSLTEFEGWECDIIGEYVIPFDNIK